MTPQPQKYDIDAIAKQLFAGMTGNLDDYPVLQDLNKPLFHEWVQGVILDGFPFSYDRHEYLIEPYKDDHPNQVELKGTQLGLTTKAILRAMYSARYKNYKGILYLFPSKSDVLDFSKSRITPLIDENPETIGKWLRDTDSAGLKQIWNTFLYLRGMKSRVGLKSVPADLIVFDELDEANQKSIDMAMERMAHSEFQETLKLSNPTLPDYGIDRAFQETDQRYWLLKCEKCNHYTDLVGTFPMEANKEVPTLLEIDGRVIRACEKCHAELNPSVGQWVAKHPDITDKRGYQYSQLWSHYIDPADILKMYRTTDNITDLFNLKIGVAFVEAENRLSAQQVLGLCGDYGIQSEDPGPCSMGVDQGKDLHVVIGKKDYNGKGRIVHIEIYKDWEELEPLIKRFNVLRCVVDALPETRNARAFAEKFKGRVWLNYYSHYQKGSYAWNEEELIVSSNRTESLDASHKQIVRGEIVLPRSNKIVQTFADQMHNVARKLEENEDTGSKRYVYVKLGADHFRHSFNYEAIARKYINAAFFSNCDLS